MRSKFSLSWNQTPISSFPMGFKKHHRISMRRATNTCQKEPEDKRSAVQRFHRNIRRKASEGEQIGPLDQWTPRQVANMDQTPLPFSFCDGETYADTGEQSVWVQGGDFGLRSTNARYS